MNLENNKKLLKEKFPKLWESVKNIFELTSLAPFEVEAAHDKSTTLFTYKDQKKIYLHSTYSPKKEAVVIINGYTDLAEHAEVMFYGVGLGYHIDELNTRHRNLKYYIYEPVPQLLYAYLSRVELTVGSLEKIKGIVVGNDPTRLENLISEYLKGSVEGSYLIELPIYKSLFQEDYTAFSTLFKKLVKDKKAATYTNYAYQKLWIVNCMKNFDDILRTPNLILNKGNLYKNKPAVIIAAGPSLNDEIEHIRYIKEKNMAYLFSVGSAINTLIHHGIYPDAACTYDPTDPATSNQFVFDVVKKKGIKDIPLIFGTSVGYQTLVDYPGDKYHIITSQDSVSDYFLKPKEQETIELVSDATSIAVITLQLVQKLGCNPIIFVGQNLAFRGKERHSKGIAYSKEIMNEELENGMWIKDVYGNEIVTDFGFDKMRKDLEAFIKHYSENHIINTTKDGAHIEGTEFLELETVIDCYFTENSITHHWPKYIEPDYDIDYARDRFSLMNNSLITARRLVEKLTIILNQINKLIRYKTYNKLEKKYNELDKVLSEIEKNDFFSIFILPMNRVMYKLLAESIEMMNQIIDPSDKGVIIETRFRKFIEACSRDIDMVEPIYEEMNEALRKM